MIDAILESTAEVVRLAMVALVQPGVSAASATLEGACGVASYALARAYKRQGIAATFVAGWHECECGLEQDCGAGIGHCWVESRGLLVDITARQFHRTAPDVFIPQGVALRRYTAEQRGPRGIAMARGWYRTNGSSWIALFNPRKIDPLIEAMLGLQARDAQAKGAA